MRGSAKWTAWSVGTVLLLSGCGGGPDAVALGETIDVGYTDSSSNTATDLAVTVLDVSQGTVEELEESGLSFDDDERANTPYYVTARYENTGEAAVERRMDVSLEDTDDNLISSTVIIDLAGDGGESGPCPNVSEGELAPGDSFEDCTLFLVPPGVEVGSVSFLSIPEEGESQFVYWKAE